MSQMILETNTNNNNNNIIRDNNTTNFLQLPPVTPRHRVVSFASTSQATRHDSSACETPDIDLEDVEDSVKPVYLRESSFYRAYIKQKEKLESDQVSTSSHHNDVIPPSQPKWKVCDPDPNAWRENTIDSRNLYSVSREDMTLLSSDDESDDECPYYDDEEDELRFHDELKRSIMGVSARVVVTDLQRLPSDVTHQREKSYITESRNTNRSPETMADSRRFWAQTIKEFNRPTQKDVKASYCSPKNSLVRQKSKQLKSMKVEDVPVEPITRVPPHLRILPRLLRGGDMCRKPPCLGKQFCDVLGPETCRACIEFANRRVAGEVQRQAFPGLDCTVGTLVAPMLSRCLVGRSLDFDDTDSSIAPQRSRRGPMSRSVGYKGKAGGFTRLPTITEAARFGRAGMERNWEEKARLFSSTQETQYLPPPMFI